MAKKRPKLFGDMGSERRKKNRHRLKNGTLTALQGTQVVERYHESADRGVEREMLDVVFLLADQFVKDLELFGRRLLIGDCQRIAVKE